MTNSESGTSLDPRLPTGRWFVPVVVGASLIATLAVVVSATLHNRREQALALERRVQQLQSSLESRVQSYIDTLPGLRLAAQAGDHLTDLGFRNYVDGISLQSRFPALAITFAAQLLPDADRDHFTAAVREDRSVLPAGHPGFDIQPPGRRPQYMVIRHLLPFQGRTFGYDLLDPGEDYRFAVQRAIDSGSYTTTAPLLLAADRHAPWNPDLVAVVIRLAVYRSSKVPTTVEERRAETIGVVGVAFKTRDLIQGLLTPELRKTARWRVVDASAADDGAQASFIFDSDPPQPPAASTPPAAPASSRDIRVGDRHWRLEVYPYATSRWPGVDANVLMLAAGGMAISLLLGGLLRSLIRTNAVANQRAEARTQALRAEQRELARSERRYRELFESTFDAVLRTNPIGGVQFANPAACALFGRTEAELCTLGRGGLADATDPRFHALLRERETTGRAHGVMRMKRADGSTFEAEVSSTLYLDDEGQAAATVVVRDISERVRLEAQLRQSHKMEAIGTLASGIAHDFNNVLATILANTALLQADDVFMAQAGARDRVNLIRQGAERARSLVRKILVFSRAEVGDVPAHDLCSTVQESVDLLRATIPPAVAISVTLPQAPVLCAIEPTQFQQIVFNLCTNAWHAIGNRAGTIAVSLSADMPDAPGFARLSVRDNGSGMNDAVRARIFDPFYTTKPRGEGTGLGLAVVHGIVTALGGHIDVQSAPGLGTTITVDLPLASSGAASAAMTQPANDALQRIGNARSVLYLDDDPVVSLSVTALLQRQGFQVTACTDVDTAAAALGAEPHRYAVLVSDQNMPRMSGVEFVGVAKRLAPKLRTVLISGLVTAEIEREAQEAGIDLIVNKEEVVDRLGVEMDRIFRRE